MSSWFLLNFFLFFFLPKENQALERINHAEELKSTPGRCSDVRSRKGTRHPEALAYLGIAPAANHCIPLGNIYTARMADQVVVNSSHVSILVSCHRAIDVMEYGVLVTIQLTIFKPGARLSKEDIQRDLMAVKTRTSQNEGCCSLSQHPLQGSYCMCIPTAFRLKQCRVSVHSCQLRHQVNQSFPLNMTWLGGKNF